VSRIVSLALAILVVVADQLSKAWVVAFLGVASGGPPYRTVTSVFNLVLALNPGVSFGLLRGDSPWNVVVLSLLAVAIVGGLLFWMWRTPSALVASAIGLVCGGALGNVIDRLRHGAVTDFLDFHWGGLHFWAFNLADSAISVGVFLLITESLLARRKSPK